MMVYPTQESHNSGQSLYDIGCLNLPNQMTSFFLMDISIKMRIRAYCILFSSKALLSALMKVPKQFPIFFSIDSHMNSTGSSWRSAHIGMQWIFANEAWKPGDHFWVDKKNPFKNQVPSETILLTSSIEGNFVTKKPLPMGNIEHWGEIFHNLRKVEATNSEENDFPTGLDMIEQAQGLHKD